MKVWDVLIIGAGPGGCQAAVAAASEGLKVLVLEKATVGGQIGQTPKLENAVFAGGSITGPEFARMMHEQASLMGAEFFKAEATGIRLLADGRKSITINAVGAHGKHLHAHTVVLAMGHKWNELTIPGIRENIGKGVFIGPVKAIGYNATGRDVAVYGGGPSAGQAILALADEANTNTVHALMRSTLSMPQYLVDRIKAHPKVKLREYTKIVDVQGRSPLLSLLIANTAGEGMVSVDALFMCNGLKPATDFLKGSDVDLDAEGRVYVGRGGKEAMETSMPGVYAIGDCRSGSTARVGVALGDGSMAVTNIWTYFSVKPTCGICGDVFAA